MTNDPALAICANRCAEDGDPPCYAVHGELLKLGKAAGDWKPCTPCLIDCGIEIVEPLDPGAVLRPLL